MTQECGFKMRMEVFNCCSELFNYAKDSSPGAKWKWMGVIFRTEPAWNWTKWFSSLKHLNTGAKYFLFLSQSLPLAHYSPFGLRLVEKFMSHIKSFINWFVINTSFQNKQDLIAPPVQILNDNSLFKIYFLVMAYVFRLWPDACCTVLYSAISISIIAVLEPLLSKSSLSVTFLSDTLEAEKRKKEFERRKELSVNYQSLYRYSAEVWWGERGGEDQSGEELGKFSINKESIPVGINLVFSIYFVSLCVGKTINETTFFFVFFFSFFIIKKHSQTLQHFSSTKIKIISPPSTRSWAWDVQCWTTC